MSAQTTYDQTPAVGFSGMLAEQFSQRQVDSYIAEGVVHFGDAVERGTNQTENMQSATILTDISLFIGVALYSIHQERVTGNSGIPYKDESEIPVMARGRIYATAGAAVVVGAEVVPSLGAATKFITGAGTSTTKAYARTAAGADGDVFIIELVGP